MTSDLTPSAAPTNINELRAKNPEPTHPNRDPVTQPASLMLRVFIANAKGTFFGMSESLEASSRR
jgi:hypothetical protein